MAYYLEIDGDKGTVSRVLTRKLAKTDKRNKRGKQKNRVHGRWKAEMEKEVQRMQGKTAVDGVLLINV